MHKLVAVIALLGLLLTEQPPHALPKYRDVDRLGNIVACSDLERSIELTFRALEDALHRGGASFSSLVRVTVYIKHLDEEKLQAYRRVRDSIIDTANLPASTVVGVHSLYNDAAIEIDAIAAV